MSVDFNEFSKKMDKTMVHLAEEFDAVRAGRANPKVLDRITVEYYGQETALNGVATLLGIGSDLHHRVVHLFTNALLGIGAPLDAAEGIVVCHKAAVLAGHLGIDRKQLDLVSAAGANLLNNRRGPGFTLATFHGHNGHLLYLVTTL